ncbi:DNA internalization-related competence protein ComEC/Rec2 [Blautia sp. MSJ-19]|uniref:DNA internalization-related competence protein ComEC/Rec2 n=1 Tax=Blautia sp. MSJ-19 TaxID=2841517 RepID=UPI001C0F2958|nr:DNA internalization-related competence protein ComEC/Rec2 [Blautia sp. MSJ-19]MBU5481022.1 DNA internalization-related competence protein ComEC/Rec2 [Blautia sp. MSJ-19]
MKTRPLCLVCLLLMFCMWFLDLAGFAMISGNPLPESVQNYITEHPDAVVCGEVQQSQASEYSLSVYLKHVSLIVGSEQIPIKNIRVFLKSNKELPVGMNVKIAGKLEEVPAPRNPGEFDSQQYYACRNIYYFMKDGKMQACSKSYSRYGQFMQKLKKQMMQTLEVAAEDDAGVFEAMLLGDKTNLEENLKIRYQMAGIIHILAISGLHISVLGIGLFDILKKAGAGNVMAGLVSLSLLLQYGMLTGEGVSTMRAVCMFLLAVGARIAGRTYDLLTALAVSAVLLLLDAPANLYNSGFWLSFGAVAGIGVAAPILTEWIKVENRKLRMFVRSLAASFAVQMMTFPIMLRIYGEISIVGFFLNLLVLPTVGIVLVSGIAGVVVGMVSGAAASYVILPGRLLLFLYEKLCETASGIPFCTWIAGSPKLWQCAVYYILLSGGLWLLSQERHTGRKKQLSNNAAEKSYRRKRGMLLGLSMIMFLAGIGCACVRPAGKLQITCLDIGQGDCILIRTPERKNFLLDSGSSNKKNIARYQILPYLKNQGIGVIDAILISHTDKDHISGVQELLDYIGQNLTSVRVDNLILPEWEQPDKAYQELMVKAREAGICVQKGRRGKNIRAGNVLLRFLAPESGATGTDANEDGMVMEMVYNGFKGLFAGDIGTETEKKLLSELDDVDFLKVGHHGSRYSTCREFLDVVRPEVAVISCSSTNTYGHPSDETIERLEDAGAKIWYTMKGGAVTVTTDGENIWIETFTDS